MLHLGFSHMVDWTVCDLGCPYSGGILHGVEVYKAVHPNPDVLHP